MAKYGLIGDPIKGSGSPALFEAAYKGVKDGEYSYDLIEGSDFEARSAAAPSRSCAGNTRSIRNTHT